MKNGHTVYRNVVGVILMLYIGIGYTYAQTTTSNTPQPITQVPAATGTTSPNVPAAYDASAGTNYVRTWQPMEPYTQVVDVITSDRTSDQVTHSTQYVDGLGRPVQTVNWEASPSNNDIVAPVTYDDYGREQYKYLPYAASSNDGSFQTNSFGEQSSFYSSTYPGEQPAITGENFYYSHTDYEPSPLNRPVKSFAPGNSWAGSEGGTAEHGAQMQYLISNAADAVQVWDITSNTLTYTNNDITTNIPTTSGIYGAYLYKTVTLDEQGNAIVEYKDMDGEIILKKVQVDNSIAADYSGYQGFLCTYYVYDDLGLLRFVVPPKATAQLIGNEFQLTAGIINELCFRYEYDSRNRMIAKKVPGAGWTYMIYDKKDRLAFTQDANMRSNSQWLYTLYDAIDRPVQTGMMQDITTPASLQAYVDGLDYAGAISIPTTPVNINGSTESDIPPVLTVTHADPQRTLYEASSEVDIDGDLILDPTTLNTPNGTITVAIVPADNNSFTSTQPVNITAIPASVTTIPLTLTYYDDYSWTTKTYDNSNNSKLDKGTNAYAEPLPAQRSVMIAGMPTGTRIRAIENATDLTQGSWIETASFYDDKARPVQVQVINYKGGLDETTALYNFTGQVLCSYAVNNNASGNVNNLEVKTNMDYDHAGRLITVTKEINDDPTTLRTITQNTYDALGQLKNKKTGQKYENGNLSTDPMEDDDYTYNIRGWLKGINWQEAEQGEGVHYSTTSNVNSGANKWFGMDLSYDYGYDKNQFNGNIGGQRWESAGDGENRSFGYGYDAADRLLYADFNQNFGSSGTDGWSKTDPNSSFNINFSVQMGDGQTASTAYDENGNILAMQQYGLQLNNSSLIDNLTYNYNTNSNKLSGVSDAITTNNKLGDFTDNNTTGPDYGYDVNGNLITDKNKYLAGSTGVDQASGGAIIYNYLNQPYLINVQNADGTAKGTITYIYDATGNKLEKHTNEQPSTSNNNQNIQITTTYIGGFVYQNNALQFFAQEEGRIRLKTATVNNCAPSATQQYVYDYFIKDNLGNIRTVLTDEQKTDIYPAATLEDGSVATESNYYSINTGNIVANPAALSSQTYQNNNGFCNPGDNNATAVSQKMYDLNASGSQVATGLGITLKVMAGDVINIYGNSFYTQNDPNPSNDNVSTPLVILGALLTTPVAQAATAAHGGATATQLLTGNNVNPADGGLPVFLNNNNEPTTPSAPTASINYIIIDDHFQFVSGGVSKVTEPFNGQLQPHNDLQNISVPKNGYIYIYCSNASPVDVYFDNLQVTQNHGPLVQDNAYSPWGLQLQGISSNAVCYGDAVTQRYKFQKQEYNDDLGVDMYEFKYRMDDPQTGRFWQVDPLADKYAYNSVYAFSEDKVISDVELEGLEAWSVTNQTDGGTGETVYGPYANQDAAQEAANSESTLVTLPDIVVTDKTPDPEQSASPGIDDVGPTGHTDVNQTFKPYESYQPSSYEGEDDIGGYMYTTTDFVVNDAEGRPVVTNPKNVEMVDMTIFTHLDGAVSPAGIPEPTDLTGWVDFLNNGVGAASVSDDDPSRGKTAAPATATPAPQPKAPSGTFKVNKIDSFKTVPIFRSDGTQSGDSEIRVPINN